MNTNEYAGFWIRAAASLIDTILVGILILPIASLFGFSGTGLGDGGVLLSAVGILLNYALPAVVIIVFWVYKSATPGKLLLKLRILDADTGNKPSNKQFIGRYLAYYVSTVVFFLGFIWAGIDERKQGWHDKLAGTVVVRNTAP